MVQVRAVSFMLLLCVIALAIAMMLQGCGRGHGGCEPGPGPEAVLYSSSFESAADTVGWAGYGDTWLAIDAPPGGGVQALGVGGGCIAPHAVFALKAVETGGHYTIRCWGKEVLAPGRVELRLAGDYEAKPISLTVEGPEWAEYSTCGCFWCPGGASLEIDVYSGGFSGPGGILLDLVEVVRVDP